MQNMLLGLSAAGANDIWAVGYSKADEQAPERTLIEHWDGNSWTIVPSPNVGAGANLNRLLGVVALGTADAWAVGFSGSFPNYQALIFRWDGTSWTAVSGLGAGSLRGLAASSSNDVWAVGASGTFGTLIYHWSGAGWQQVSAPDPKPGLSLFSVTVLSPTDAWAVGGNPSGGGRTLILHWNGAQWSEVSDPNGDFAILYAVGAASANDVWAVGHYFANPHEYYTHWDGTQWTGRTPQGTTNEIRLVGLVVLASNEIYAVGRGSGEVLNTIVTVVERWNGTQWSRLPSANPGSPWNSFDAVIALSRNDMWAVGSTGDVWTQTHTLTVHASNPCPGSCPVYFSDVYPTDYFYGAVAYLYCHGVISGYGDETFRPYNNTTRGQLAKIVVLGFGMPIYTPPTPTFNDVPVTDAFYQSIETAYHAGLVSGYSCGGPGEPCPGVYYRPGNLVTRGQLSKIVVIAAGWELLDPSSATFRDVAVGSTFFRYVETAYSRGIISGYNCGTNCLEFRPGNNAIRGQICKIVYQAITHPSSGSP